MESKLWGGLLQRERLSSAQVCKILKSAHSDGRVFLSEMHCGSSIDLVEATLQLPNRTKDFLWNFLHCFIFGCRPFYFCLANNLLFISFWGFFSPLLFKAELLSGKNWPQSCCQRPCYLCRAVTKAFPYKASLSF